MHVYNQAPRQKYLHLTHISILDKHYRSESNDTDTLFAFQVDLTLLNGKLQARTYWSSGLASLYFFRCWTARG